MDSKTPICSLSHDGQKFAIKPEHVYEKCQEWHCLFTLKMRLGGITGILPMVASLAFCQWFDTSSTEQLIIGGFSSMDDNAFDEQLMQP
ncbi:hypothetical protein T4D_309 [Trichinella pseudospiralis]|uniref:Uncharacterized protein n=1 Tax=Trichinella pseudospiralis TaxID=6337 RepID=A0A0V1F5J7_TRIPS|nr:hypothetical protein T4D_309 [Trichinella pseudospiralis]